MPHAVCQAITGGSDPIGAMLCLGGCDGGGEVCHHHGAHPTGRGHGGTPPAANANGLPFQVQIGGTNGADGAGHNEWGGCELREL